MCVLLKVLSAHLFLFLLSIWSNAGELVVSLKGRKEKLEGGKRAGGMQWEKVMPRTLIIGGGA